jgi:hypothetical protein
VLFAYVFEAVSGGKGMMQLKIDSSKNQTINNLLHETFPSIKCFDNEKLRVINPKTVAYIHALRVIIDSILLVFADSINPRAHAHEGAMVDVYSKMKPDALSQLQTVLTAYYEDIKGFVGASGCTKSKVIKRKFEDSDQEGTEPTAAADTEADAAAAAAAPPRRTGARQPHPAGRSLHRPPALGARAGAARRGGAGGVESLPRPKADAY